MNEVKYYVVVLTAGDKAEIVEKEVPANAGSNLYRLAEKTLGCGYAELVRPVGFMGKYGFFISETSAITFRQICTQALYMGQTSTGIRFTGMPWW